MHMPIYAYVYLKYMNVQSFMGTCIYLNTIFKLEKNAHFLKYGGVSEPLYSPKDF